jgi:hypothetical protein
MYLNDKDFRPSKEADKKVRTLMLAEAIRLIHYNYHLGKDSKLRMG